MSYSTQVTSRTQQVVGQTKNYISKIWNNIKVYPLYWIIGVLLFYIIFWRRECKESENFYDINWEQLGQANQSFGRTSVVAKLNDAVWGCMPNGEYYVMRYNRDPAAQKYKYFAKKAKSVRKGYYNSCN